MATSNAYKVNSAQLVSRESQLRSLNNQFRTEVNNLKTAESSLNTSWDGDANDAFHTAFINDANQMENFYNLVVKYCDALHQIHQNYDKAEAVNTGTAKTRTYK